MGSPPVADTSVTSNSPPVPPSYDFEEMLKKAMEAEGEVIDDEPIPAKEPENKTKKFLKRRKVYDPKKAIEEEGKQKRKKFKSALPDAI